MANAAASEQSVEIPMISSNGILPSIAIYISSNLAQKVVNVRTEATLSLVLDYDAVNTRASKRKRIHNRRHT